MMMRLYIYIYIHTHTHIYIYIYIDMYVYIYIYAYIYVKCFVVYLKPIRPTKPQHEALSRSSVERCQPQELGLALLGLKRSFKFYGHFYNALGALMTRPFETLLETTHKKKEQELPHKPHDNP